MLTVGEFFRLVALTGLITAVTLTTYKTKLRTIIAFVCELGSGRAKGVRHLEWRQNVEEQPLSVVSLAALKNFKRHMLSRKEDNSEALEHAKTTFDGYLRNMRSLFRQEVLDELSSLGVDVIPPPFHEMTYSMKGRSAYAYVSKIQAESLMRAAIADLSVREPGAFLIFVLALLLGLRRQEIDRLRWDMINWERQHIALSPHEFLHLKTKGSAAEIRLDPAMISFLRSYREITKGEYLVHSENTPRNANHYRHYRCERLFKSVNRWLRQNGVNTMCPLHTLRKEYGSLVVEKFGLVAAKDALRHASIDITVTYYVRDRRPINSGLEKLLPFREIDAPSSN